MSAPPKNFYVLEIIFALMLVSGFLLAIHYVPHEDHAFESVQMIMRDVGYGWLVRYLHMNGASFMFIALYVNMFRGIYHGSFKKPGEPLWITGVVILFMTIVCAFTGYVLALSQMGGWAATVITGMFTAVPFIGESLKETVLGGDSLGTATLTRFYAIHFTVPFLILLLVMTRIRSLRAEQPDIPKRNNCKSLLWPGSFMLAFVVVTFFFPETLSPSEHFLPYDPLPMPERIVPQWD